MLCYFGVWHAFAGGGRFSPTLSYAVPMGYTPPKTELDLLAEIAALRAEVAELKRHLNPPIQPA